VVYGSDWYALELRLRRKCFDADHAA
jgi:hypothetical protein